MEFKSAIDQLGLDINNISFLQIGACDGIIADSVFEYAKKYNWDGVLVEPIPYLFERLKINYGWSKKVRFENSAVSHNSVPRKMHMVAEEFIDKLPDWSIGISSFYDNRNAIGYHDINPYTKEITVNCIDFNSLLIKYNIHNIDLLQIDVEGYDYEIIKQIDFNNIVPKIVRYEHANISTEDNLSCKTLLKSAGYTTYDEGYDTICLYQ
jgi:FkbM family methyltransferase